MSTADAPNLMTVCESRRIWLEPFQTTRSCMDTHRRTSTSACPSSATDVPLIVAAEVRLWRVALETPSIRDKLLARHRRQLPNYPEHAILRTKKRR